MVIDTAKLQEGLRLVSEAFGEQNGVYITGIALDWAAMRMMLSTAGTSFKDTVAITMDGALVDVRRHDQKPLSVAIPIDRSHLV